MLSVKFNGPVVVDEKNLCALLSIVNCQVTVEPVTADAPVVRRGRKPKEDVVGEDVPVVETPSVDPAPAPAPAKRRGRKSNAEKAAEAAANAPQDPVKEPESEPEAPAPEGDFDPNVLLGRFSKLIEKDFALAKNILDELGVERFSDLEGKDYPAFAGKLDEAGV